MKWSMREKLQKKKKKVWTEGEYTFRALQAGWEALVIY